VELDLELAASFLALAEESHFGRAAARLHLTSPALTKRIQRLERQLGVEVVQRGSSGVLRLTPAGKRLANAIGPLLAHASAVRAAAIRPPGHYRICIGVPAGSGHFLAGVDLGGMVRTIHRTFPEAHFMCREVPFSALDDCLSSGYVDVLWNSAPVRHADVESVLLSVGSPIIGAVSAIHPLADAGSVDAGVFCEETFLYNPTLPREWMDPFWLADLRPRRDARLVEFVADEQVAVLRKISTGGMVVALPAIMGPLLPARLRAVELVGAPRVSFFAARRRNDRRDGVEALMQAFQGLAQDAFGVNGMSSRSS
jgi:DNA-binding transcriptional LysR family regulator